MPTVGTFVCECGARLTIMSAGKTSNNPLQTTIIPCPGGACKVRHIASGEVLEVFVVSEDGKSAPYDWKARLVTK